MRTTPSPDARAVVKAVASLTTQVGRIADALTTPVVEHVDGESTTPSNRVPCPYCVAPTMIASTLITDHIARLHNVGLATYRPYPAADDDGATMPLDDAVYCPLCPDAPRLLNPADATNHFRTKHPEQRLNTSGAWPLLVPDEGPRCVECGSSAVTYRNYREQPFCGPCANGERQAPPDDEHERCITHFHGACDGTTRDCAFPTPGTGRRRSLRVLLNRLNNGVALTPDEVQLLTRHVATEITEHNTARAVAAGNKRHVQTLVPALQRAEADANHNADQVADAVRRAESAERDLRTLRAGLRAAGGDPTQIQNLWAQLRMRNRQWAEAKREARAFRDMLEDPRDVSLVDEMLATVAAAEEKAREARHERDVIAADLETADQSRAEVQRDRDQHAAVLAEVLGRFSHAYNEHGTFTGHQCTSIPDETFQRWHSVVAPTVERPWWEQVALYEKAAIEATKHVLELKAAIERVRSYVTDAKARYAHGRNDYEIGKHDLAGTVLGALDGTEQPTT